VGTKKLSQASGQPGKVLALFRLTFFVFYQSVSGDGFSETGAKNQPAPDWLMKLLPMSV
jgi:hypothetical protein